MACKRPHNPHLLASLSCVPQLPYRAVQPYYAVQVDGQAHVVHSEYEAAGTRLLVNGLTVLLEAEADPSRLLAASPGKLVRRLVPHGAAVARDQPYAEMEVGTGNVCGWRLIELTCPLCMLPTRDILLHYTALHTVLTFLPTHVP